MKYLAEWDKDKEKTWSGTTFALLCALQANCDVGVVNTKVSILTRLKSILSDFSRFHRIETNINLNLSFQKTLNLRYGALGEQGEDVLQIGDLSSIENSFIYQDLSFGMLLKWRKQNFDSFNSSGFQDIPIETMKQRNEIQLDRYNSAKGVLTMSHSLERFLIDDQVLPPDKVYYVGAGVNTRENEYRRKIIQNRQRSNILFVGRDFFRKGGDIVVEAFKLLRANFIPDAKLVIAGYFDDDINKVEGITCLGDVSNQKISDLFDWADVFCMPSRFEAFGLVYAEALSNGVPVIARNQLEASYMITPGVNGDLVSDDDALSLARTLNRVLKSTTIYEKTFEEIPYVTREYSWDTVAKKIISIMQK